MQAGATFNEAVSAARTSAGQSMYYLALCLVAGFSVYLLSSIASLAMFGVLVALVIFIGLIWECLVMPAYLSVLHHFGLFRVSPNQRGSHAHADH
jgi:predicted RND superfamily exporter protein